MNLKSFFTELKRRNVYKVAVAYTVVGWLLIQVATQVFPFFEIPNWAVRLIVLVIVLGFPIALVIAWAFELTPEGVKRTEAGETAPASTPPGGRTWIYLALAGALASLALFFVGRHTAPRLDPDQPRSIAVLPFENRSEDKANAYFADGIQDEILTRLAKIDGLKVISRTSTQGYRSSPENLPEIAKQLGVAHVLEGSVQKIGDQVRVNVQLIRAETDAHLWAEVYDRKLADIFAVQSDIAESVARTLSAKLSPREQTAVAAKPTNNPEAYDAYLRGLAVWSSLDMSAEGRETMARFYGQAVELDPTFALAWAHLSVVRTLYYAAADPSAERLAEAKRALDTAFKLQPNLGEAHFALGLYRYRGLGDYDGALQAFQQAIEHGVNRAMSLDFSAYVRRRQGKWEEALQLHARSAEIDPLNPIIHSERASTLTALGRHREALAAVDRALEIRPDDSNLISQKAGILQLQGDFAAAQPLLDRLPVDAQQFIPPRLMQWFCTGRHVEAARFLEEILGRGEAPPRHLAAYYRRELGFAKQLEGDAAGATRELERARAEFAALREQSERGEGFLDESIVIHGLLGDKAGVDLLAEKAQRRIASDAVSGPYLESAIAIARAQLGERDAALAQLRTLLQKPGNDEITPATLRVHPFWLSLRGDPRFQELLATGNR